jgi:mevalonate pyrophosphate decarboxylase
MLTFGNGCKAIVFPTFSQDSMASDNDINTILENLKRFGKLEKTPSAITSPRRFDIAMLSWSSAAAAAGESQASARCNGGEFP